MRQRNKNHKEMVNAINCKRVVLEVSIRNNDINSTAIGTLACGFYFLLDDK